MRRQATYVEQLVSAPDRERLLRSGSGLPGPRANLELLQAAADVGDERSFREWIAAASRADPTDEFLVMCGIVGMGRLIAEGRGALLEELRAYAVDPRWRVREAVAIALQRVGDHDLDALFRAIRPWVIGRPYLQRAAAAAVCEPRLLKSAAVGRRALALLEQIMTAIVRIPYSERRSDEFRTLRQALGYCWSVAVVADPVDGKRALERWARSADPDVRWIVRENLRKRRLSLMDSGWTARLSKP